MGLKRPGTIPFWTPSASDMAMPRGKALPVSTLFAARFLTSSVMRFSVPSWSSGPHRPQLFTWRAMAANFSGTPIGAARYSAHPPVGTLPRISLFVLDYSLHVVNSVVVEPPLCVLSEGDFRAGPPVVAPVRLGGLHYAPTGVVGNRLSTGRHGRRGRRGDGGLRRRVPGHAGERLDARDGD